MWRARLAVALAVAGDNESYALHDLCRLGGAAIQILGGLWRQALLAAELRDGGAQRPVDR